MHFAHLCRGGSGFVSFPTMRDYELKLIRKAMFIQLKSEDEFSDFRQLS
jgi:hypothetical protein